MRSDCTDAHRASNAPRLNAKEVLMHRVYSAARGARPAPVACRSNGPSPKPWGDWHQRHSARSVGTAGLVRRRAHGAFAMHQPPATKDVCCRAGAGVRALRECCANRKLDSVFATALGSQAAKQHRLPSPAPTGRGASPAAEAHALQVRGKQLPHCFQNTAGWDSPTEIRLPNRCRLYPIRSADRVAVPHWICRFQANPPGK